MTDTYVSFAGGSAAAPFDYFHVNSISIAPDGNLLLSARNASTVYKVSRTTGQVVWQLGGKRSSFTMGPGATFYFSQFSADGTLILDGQFPVGDQSYRAFTAAWTGHPADKPAVAARVNQAGGSVVYASWNGATEVSTWTVLAGPTAGALTEVGSQPRSGFETTITVSSAGPYFAVTAHDAGHHVLGQSPTVQVMSG